MTGGEDVTDLSKPVTVLRLLVVLWVTESHVARPLLGVSKMKGPVKRKRFRDGASIRS